VGGGSACCDEACPTGFLCNGDGQCVSPESDLGVICTTGADCLGGRCFDGRCCDVACGGLCERCNAPGQEGRCVAAPTGSLEPGCPANLECDGRAQCRGPLGNACALNDDCRSGFCEPALSTGGEICCEATCLNGQRCGTDGNCVDAPEPDGSTCVNASDCASNSCVGGRCCESACQGICEACSGLGDCNVNPGNDARCPAVDCPQSNTVCTIFPADITVNLCVALRTCRTSQGACQPRFAQANTPCEDVAPGVPGRCDGAGNCRDSRVTAGASCSSDAQCGSGNCEPSYTGQGSVCCAARCAGSDRCSTDFAECRSPVSQVVVGDSHSCALMESGSVRCWGRGAFGVLGYGRIITGIGDNEAPASAGNVDIGGTAIQLDAGADHTCALLDTGDVRCWGNGRNGQLGYASEEDIGVEQTPGSMPPIDIGGSVQQISAGAFHTCALLSTGNVRCWGTGNQGQLGYGDTNDVGDVQTPASKGDVNVGGAVAQISAGTSTTCALLTTGNVRCWGNNQSGQLGYGNTNRVGDILAPASAGDVEVGGVVRQIAAGSSFSCALLTTGQVRCWGSGTSLGYGGGEAIGDDEDPASAGDVNVGGTVTQISAARHTCAVLDTGDVRCWGRNSEAQLGYGHLTNVELAELAGSVSLGSRTVQLSAGAFHTCAVLATGNVRCWGDGAFGKLGYGNVNNLGDIAVPTSVGVLDL
jgi:alpha-tubulin suppressor-like RCC1 family protein